MNVTALAGLLMQSAFVLIVGLALPCLLRLKQPLLRLRYWQALLGISLVLPLLPTLMMPRPENSLRIAGHLVVEVVADAVPSDQTGDTSAWLTAAVATVGFGFAIRLALGLAALTRLRRRALTLDPLPVSIRTAQSRIGCSALFMVSEHTTVPVTFGWLRPVVLLPRSFLELSPESQEAIICHELLHVRRRHWPVALAEELIRAALWFHPGVWILLGRIALAREQVVDADVVNATGRRRSYLEGLWHMARGASVAPAAPAIALLNRSHLKERVALLIQEVAMSRTHVTVAVFIAGIVIGTVVATAIGAFPTTVHALPITTPPAPTTSEADTEAEASETRKFHVGGPITEPVVIHKVNPTYPEEARKNKIQGSVVVETEVSEEGLIESIKILKATDPIFEQPAIDALEQWRFKPATLEGEPVAVYFNLTVNFRLE